MTDELPLTHTEKRSAMERLADNTEDLASDVKELTRKLNVTETVVKRGKRNQRFIIAILTAVVILLGITLNLIGENKANAKRGCENANESRAGALLLWTTILDAPRPTAAPKRTPEEIAQLDALREFTEQLYMQRDCNDLGREYPLPVVPPALGG